ncbi:MAG: hypothetical protein M3442_12905 [Chloroflexota bacterium]|nr:hypothetical protein [Chloroflexota bacterium]
MIDAAGGGLRAGYSVVDITPPPGVDLTGFGAREGPCVGTLDPLQARALVFEDASGRRVALVTCDLIGLGRHLVARVRRRVAEVAGIPAAGQLFNCSHTHAGPETGVLTTIGVPDPAYLAALEERLVAVLAEAATALFPVRLRLASTEVEDGLAINRVFRRIGQPERYDRQLTVVRIERVPPTGAAAVGESAGRPLATIVAFACHAVTLGAAERHASADFVAPLRHDLEAAGSGPVLYVNGCGGDVNPAAMDARGREATDALGRELARAARRAQARALSEEGPIQEGSTEEGPTEEEPSAAVSPEAGSPPGSPLQEVSASGGVGAAQEWVALPFQPLRTPAELAEILAHGRARLAEAPSGSPAYRAAQVTEVDYPLRVLRLHYGSELLPEVRAEVQAIKVGPIAIVALPGEIFSSLGRAIKEAAPFPAPRTIVAGWSNDNVGYIPDRDAYPLGGYEVDLASRYYGYPAGWAEGAGEALVATAGRVLARLAKES